MYDGTIHAKTIARHIEKGDFVQGALQITSENRERVIEETVRLARHGFRRVTLRTGSVRGKRIYRQVRIEEALLVRHVTENVRRITGVKQSDRNSIIKCLRDLLTEGLEFRVIKLDVKAFYETIDVAPIVESLRSDPAFSRQSIHVLETFFACLASQNVKGLPRGVGLSATLAEYAMRPFDARLRDLPGVRFYNRFVDDIVIVTSMDLKPADVIAQAVRSLPSGLGLSSEKCRSFALSKFAKGAAAPVPDCEFTFLGYIFRVSKPFRASSSEPISRSVKLDIAPKKVVRLKTRVSRCFNDFRQNGNFDLLRRRLRMLTANYEFADKRTGRTRFSGIRYNYPLIDLETSHSLPALDRYLCNLIFSADPKKRLHVSLSSNQRRQLSGLTFTLGYKNNRFFTFAIEELTSLTQCWSHA